MVKRYEEGLLYMNCSYCVTYFSYFLFNYKQQGFFNIPQYLEASKQS